MSAAAWLSLGEWLKQVGTLLIGVGLGMCLTAHRFRRDAERVQAAARQVIEAAHRVAEDYRQVHVPERCQTGGCTCPCGWCRHDRRHQPGGVAAP